MCQCYYHFNHSILSEKQAKHLRNYLVSQGLIDEHITDQEFAYLLTGVGAPTAKKILWKASITLLSIYIYEIRDPQYRPEWNVAEKVFEGIKARSLSDNHSKPFSADSSRSFDAFFNNQDKVKKLIADITSD